MQPNDYKIRRRSPLSKKRHVITVKWKNAENWNEQESCDPTWSYAGPAVFEDAFTFLTWENHKQDISYNGNTNMVRAYYLVDNWIESECDTSAPVELTSRKCQENSALDQFRQFVWLKSGYVSYIQQTHMDRT